MKMDLKKKFVREITESQLTKKDNVQNSAPYKITILGMGENGNACAASLIRHYAKPIHLCFIDVQKDKAKTLTTDLDHCSAYFPGITFTSSSDLAESKDSNIIIICLESSPYREDIENFNLAEHYLTLFKSIIPRICAFSPKGILLNCTFPFNIITHIIWLLSKFPKNRVLGLGSCIETIYFHSALGKLFNVSPNLCRGWIIGTGIEHTLVVWSSVSIGGVNYVKFIPDNVIGASDRDQILNDNYDVKNFFINIRTVPRLTLAALTYSICDSIINDTKKVFTTSVLAKGIHGIDVEIFMGLPCVIGSNGIHSIVEQNLSRFELNFLRDATIKLKQLFFDNKYKLDILFKQFIALQLKQE